MSSDEEARAWLREHFLRTLTKFNGNSHLVSECNTSNNCFFAVQERMLFLQCIRILWLLANMSAQVQI